MKKGIDYDLDPTTRYVALILGNFANSETGAIYPGLETLELYTGLSERQIRRCIKKLIAVGLLDYGDQSVVSSFRQDRRPKVYEFTSDRPAHKPDLSAVGRMPAKRKRPWSRTPKPAAPVDNPTPRHRRPDTKSPATGQAGGHTVHQSFNPSNNPSAHADAGPVEVDHDAVYRLRAAARERLARKGMVFTVPLFDFAPA